MNEFIINSKQNKFYKELKALKVASRLKKENEFIAEGEKVIKTLCNKIKPIFIIFSENSYLNPRYKELSELYNIKIFNQSLFNELSNISIDNTDCMLACFEKFTIKNLITNNGNKYLLLNNIQDPGNLGTIIRTASLLGWQNIILQNCCDIFSHKVIKASSGGLIYCDFFSDTKENISKFLLNYSFDILCTSLSKNSQPFDEYKKTNKNNICLVLGNEGNGVDDFWMYHENSKKITVKTQQLEGLDSLNVSIAAGILMSTMNN